MKGEFVVEYTGDLVDLRVAMEREEVLGGECKIFYSEYFFYILLILFVCRKLHVLFQTLWKNNVVSVQNIIYICNAIIYNIFCQ